MSWSYIQVNRLLNSAISVTVLGEAAHHLQQWHVFDINWSFVLIRFDGLIV